MRIIVRISPYRCQVVSHASISPHTKKTYITRMHRAVVFSITEHFLAYWRWLSAYMVCTWRSLPHELNSKRKLRVLLVSWAFFRWWPRIILLNWQIIWCFVQFFTQFCVLCIESNCERRTCFDIDKNQRFKIIKTKNTLCIPRNFN